MSFISHRGLFQKGTAASDAFGVFLKLDYLQFQSQLQIRSRADGSPTVLDPIRRKHIVVTPEEILRQLTLQYLLIAKSYPATRIRSEIGIEVNGMPRRCDIVVFDALVQPWLLVECKSPKIKLNQSVMEQAVRYNMTLKVPFLAITNGLQTCCCAIDYETSSFTFLDDFPSFG